MRKGKLPPLLQLHRSLSPSPSPLPPGECLFVRASALRWEDTRGALRPCGSCLILSTLGRCTGRVARGAVGQGGMETVVGGPAAREEVAEVPRERLSRGLCSGAAQAPGPGRRPASPGFS